MSTGRAQEMQKGSLEFLARALSCEAIDMRKVAGAVVFLAVWGSWLSAQSLGNNVVAMRCCGSLFDVAAKRCAKTLSSSSKESRREKIKEITSSAPAATEVIDLSGETCLTGADRKLKA